MKWGLFLFVTAVLLIFYVIPWIVGATTERDYDRFYDQMHHDMDAHRNTVRITRDPGLSMDRRGQ